MADIVDFNPLRAVDRDGLPVAGAKATFFASGTTTPIVVFSDQAGTVPHPSPLLADGRGIFPPVFTDASLRVVVTDANDVTLPGYPIDPVQVVSVGSGASQIAFSPTGSIPETNVQDAIERVQANLVAPLIAGGLGVTGNAPLIANLDATNTASGAGRYDNTTTGTFPAGVTAAAGGTYRLWRETSAEAIMILTARGTNLQFIRTLTGSVWGAWARVTPNRADLGATTVGEAVFTAASEDAARNATFTPARPTASAVVGQFTRIAPGAGATVVLPGPSSQQWAYCVYLFSGSGAVLNNFAGVAAGGTTITGAGPSDSGLGFAWRISG
jgi:hypothetical protein